MPATEFSGFPPEMAGFFAELSAHNEKAWFDTHRHEYVEYVKQPTEAFGDAMADLLADIAAGPPPEARMFRINRDLRFSKDKTPYKTHVGVVLGDPRGKKEESPGFYFHLEPPTLFLAAGLHTFPKPVLQAYREAVAGDEGDRLDGILEQVRTAGPYEVWGETYKRVPQGYDGDHPHADLLRYGGLFAGITLADPPELYGPGLLDLCLRHYRAVAPVQHWLVELMERVR